MSIPQPLPHEEQRVLVRQAQQGDRRARETLIRTNEHLILKYERRVNRRDYAERDDLMQAGRIGINHAIDKFEEDKGTTFATYAGWWIRSEMQHTIAEVVTLGGFTPEQVLFNRKATQPSEELTLLTKHAARGMFRLDAPVGDEDMTFTDLLLSETPLEDEQYIHAASEASRSRAVQTMFSALRPREIAIAQRRFMEDEPDSLEAIGQDFGITRERVRQLESEVLDRLERVARQNPTVMDALRQEGIGVSTGRGNAVSSEDSTQVRLSGAGTSTPRTKRHSERRRARPRKAVQPQPLDEQTSTNGGESDLIGFTQHDLSAAFNRRARPCSPAPGAAPRSKR